jgi:S-adenosylmethionine:tRNA ribosyltransferase-isomerase
MRPASAPSAPEKLLLVDPVRGAFADTEPRSLARLLAPGDLLVVNDAATLPASLAGRTPRGEPVEVRLLGLASDGLTKATPSGSSFRAVLLGAGDWRTRTEHRPPPPSLEAGDAIELGPGFRCMIESLSALSPRLVSIRFDRSGSDLYRALYELGRPIQYAHVPEALELWSVQTGYAARPWAVEMPSAGRPLTFEVLLEAKRRGVGLATLTHAAGVSATGDPLIDAALPLPERFEIPAATVAAIASARGRVIAVGTSVVRALEGSFAKHGRVVAGADETDLVIRSNFPLRVVSALLTGMHEKDASHFELLQAFAGRELLERAYAHAEAAGYRGHEFGDATLILAA